MHLILVTCHFSAILNRFYFTPGRDLNAGDCSLNILSVQEEDIGNWTCAAVVDNEISESSDTIYVYINGELFLALLLKKRYKTRCMKKMGSEIKKNI